jgi:hypothetical protein
MHLRANKKTKFPVMKPNDESAKLPTDQRPPRGSSPQIQEDLDLNKDATWYPKKGEGEKLRNDD